MMTATGYESYKYTCNNCDENFNVEVQSTFFVRFCPICGNKLKTENKDYYE